MAIDAATEWRVNSDGADTNGGGFVVGSGGTDWRDTETAAKESRADGAYAGGAVVEFTSAGASFDANDSLGNIIQITATGDNTTVIVGFYEIVAVNSDTSVDLDRDPTDGGGADLNVSFSYGGTLKSIGAVGRAWADAGKSDISGQTLYIQKNANIAVNANTANIDTGYLVTPNDKAFTIVGYDSNRTLNNTDDQPTIENTLGSILRAFDLNGNGVTEQCIVRNLIFDETTNGFTRTIDGRSAAYCHVDRVTINGNNGSGTRDGIVGATCTNCIVNNKDGDGFQSCYAAYCTANGCDDMGFNSCSNTLIHCIARDCTIGFNAISTPYITDCTSEGNSSHGFKFSDNDRVYAAINCVSEGNGGDGFEDGTSGLVLLRNCASSNNTGVRVSANGSIVVDIDPVVMDAGGHATVFEDVATVDMRPTDDAGEGLLLREGGIWAPGSANNDTQDIGAVQHTIAAPGGFSIPVAMHHYTKSITAA